MRRSPVHRWLLHPRVAAALLVTAVATAAAPAADAATGRWSRPERLDRAPLTSSPKVGLDARGNATALFTTWEQEGGLQVVDRPARGRVSAPRRLPGGQPFDLAVAPSGAAVAAFYTGDDEGRYVGISSRPPGGEFGPTERVPVGDRSLRGLSTEINARGDAVVAWIDALSSGRPEPGRVAAVTRSMEGDMSPLEVVSSPTRDAVNIEVAVDRLGGAVLAFTSRMGDQSAVEAAIRPSGDAFGAAARLSRPDELVEYQTSQVQLAVGEAGDAAVAWEGRKAGTSAIYGTNLRASVARRTPGAAFAPARVLTAPGATNVDVAVGPGGEVAAAWGQGRPGNKEAENPRQRLRVAFARRGGSLSRPRTLRGLDYGFHEPAVAIDARGTTTVLWATSSTDAPRVQVARRLPGRPFSKRVQLRGPKSADLYYLYDLAVNPVGGAVALWDDGFTGINDYDYGALSVHESPDAR